LSRRAEIATAFGLLSRLPTGWLSDGGQYGAMGRSVWAFPLVGAAAGIIGSLTFWVVSGIGSPPAVAAVFALAAMGLATGAMHEDGLADCADGFGGGTDTARKLEIMRDSRIGSYGVIALVLVFALRIALLSSLATPSAVFAALVASAALSRGGMGLFMALVDRARMDGLSVNVGRPDSRAALEAVALAVLIASLTLPFTTALAACLGAAAGFIAVGALAIRQIGGQTGDVVGAAGIAAECLALTAIVAAAA